MMALASWQGPANLIEVDTRFPKLALGMFKSFGVYKAIQRNPELGHRCSRKKYSRMAIRPESLEVELLVRAYWGPR